MENKCLIFTIFPVFQSYMLKIIKYFFKTPNLKNEKLNDFFEFLQPF